MSDDRRRAATADYLRYQYADAEKFLIRVEAHARYSETPGGGFREWLLGLTAPAPGMSALDVGCGPGTYHAVLCAAGVRVTACDASPGMVKEVRARAAKGGLAVDATVGDAEALAFRSAAFDLVFANHMLYHVADQTAALREMHRVLRPGGRVVLATNAAYNCARIDTLHEEAARAEGYEPRPSGALRFTLDHLPLVRSVFPSAEMHERKDAFVFPDAASAVRYYASGFIDAIQDRPADNSHRPKLAARMTDAIGRIVEAEGVFRVPKAAGCFIATR